MAHPYNDMVKKSVARRLSAVGAKAGKEHGHSSMEVRGGASYPKKNAGSQVPFFAAGGGVAAPRADRMARGGAKKGHKKSGHTTNVVIAMGRHGPGEGAEAGRPVPIPVPAGGPPVMPPPMARPPIAPPGASGPPLPPGGPPGLPPGMPPGLPPGLPPGIRPPGMKRGGAVEYAGFPHSAEGGGDATAEKRGGSVKGRKHARGGKVHGDEAEDKKLFGKMMKEHEKKAGKLKSGGSVIGKSRTDYGEGAAYPVMHSGNGGLGRLEKIKKAPVG